MQYSMYSDRLYSTLDRYLFSFVGIMDGQGRESLSLMKHGRLLAERLVHALGHNQEIGGERGRQSKWR